MRRVRGDISNLGGLADAAIEVGDINSGQRDPIDYLSCSHNLPEGLAVYDCLVTEPYTEAAGWDALCSLSLDGGDYKRGNVGYLHRK